MTNMETIMLIGLILFIPTIIGGLLTLYFMALSQDGCAERLDSFEPDDFIDYRPPNHEEVKDQ